MKKKVLIVEDDAIIGRIYQSLLVREGLEVEIVTDGQCASERVAEFRPDLVLLDLMLPRRSGVQILKEIRATAGLVSMPVLVSSNAFLGTLMREAMLAGATHCFAKAQTSPKQVVQSIRDYLALSPPKLAGPTDALDVVSPATVEIAPRAVPIFVEIPDVPGMVERATRASETAGGEIMLMRRCLNALTKAEDRPARLEHLAGLCLSLTKCGASNPQLKRVVQLSEALGAFALELRQNGAKPNPVLLRALAQGVDCVSALLTTSGKASKDADRTLMALVVDDNAVTRRLICSCLQRVGMHCLEVYDPKMAPRVLLADSFDIVLLDADMPEVNGFELCRQIRQSEENKHTPVVIVTGSTNLESRALSIMSGADDVLTKPFSPAELGCKALLHIFDRRDKLKAPRVPRNAAAPGPDSAVAVLP